MTFRKYTALLLACAVISACGLHAAQTGGGPKTGKVGDADASGKSPWGAWLSKGWYYGQAVVVGACEGGMLATGGRAAVGSVPASRVSSLAASDDRWGQLILVSSILGVGRRVFDVYKGVRPGICAEQVTVNQALALEVNRLHQNQNHMHFALSLRPRDYTTIIAEGVQITDLRDFIKAESDNRSAFIQKHRSNGDLDTFAPGFNMMRSDLVRQMVCDAAAAQ